MKKAIVVGAGPALKKFKHLEQIRDSNFKGTVVLTDKVFAQALEMGIRPDKFDVVVVSSEYGNDIHLHYWKEPIDKYGKGSRAWIYTPDNKVTQYLESCGIEVHTWEANNKVAEANSLANVGAISWFTAWHYLGCDTIALVGMNQGYPMEWSKHFPPHYIGKYIKVKHSDVYNQDFLLDPLYSYYHKAFLFFLGLKKDVVNTWNCTGEGSIDHNCTIGTLEEFLKL